MTTIINKVKAAVGNQSHANNDSHTPANVPEQFTGYAAMDKEAGQRLDVVEYSYTPQKWTEDLIDIQITHCGICGSCIHTLRSGWSESTYPAICGHEIVGTVVRAGSSSGHAIGHRVGVGAQAGACGNCKYCKAGNIQFCQEALVPTYQGKWSDGSLSQGGYANYVRVQGRLAVMIPDQLDSAVAAPMMCAGVTTYNPIKTGGAGPGKKVAVVGIGGLGHLGLQWAAALGAETYAISHSNHKKADAEKLGVKPENFIIADDIEKTVKEWGNTFDLVVCTSFQEDLPIENLYLPLIAPMGQLTLCGLPEDKLPPIKPQAFVQKGVKIAGSFIGSVDQIKEMLQLAVEKNVRTWVEEHPMKEADHWLKAMDKTGAHYRHVLIN